MGNSVRLYLLADSCSTSSRSLYYGACRRTNGHAAFEGKYVWCLGVSEFTRGHLFPREGAYFNLYCATSPSKPVDEVVACRPAF